MNLRNAYRLGCDVSPLTEADARSMMTQPLRAISRQVASCPPQVSCVWKLKGYAPAVALRIACMNGSAICGRNRPDMSLIPMMCTAGQR